MRFFLLFLIAISISALGEPIKDFAPAQVGNTWKYQVVFLNGDILMVDSESFSRTFKLAKIEIDQNSQRYIFDVTDSGNNFFGVNGKYNFMGTIKNNYLATLLKIGDTLQNTLPTTSKEGTFFPLFKTSIIDNKDSGMKKVLYKNASLFQFSDFYSYFPWINHAIYMQNIGLDSLSSYWWASGNSWESLSAKLISYSVVPTSIAQSPKKFNPVQANRQNAPSAYIFDLQGKRFQQRSLSALPPGLMINRGKSYLQVK
jgi:hypothetical protein